LAASGGIFAAGRGGDGELAGPPEGLSPVKPRLAERREDFRWALLPTPKTVGRETPARAAICSIVAPA